MIGLVICTLLICATVIICIFSNVFMEGFSTITVISRGERYDVARFRLCAVETVVMGRAKRKPKPSMPRWYWLDQDGGRHPNKDRGKDKYCNQRW